MLRITPARFTDGNPGLVLEGKLVGPWVAELEVAAKAAAEGRILSLDMAGVQFVDPAGLALLRKLLDQRVVVQAASPFILELLKLK